MVAVPPHNALAQLNWKAAAVVHAQPNIKSTIHSDDQPLALARIPHLQQGGDNLVLSTNTSV